MTRFALAILLFFMTAGVGLAQQAQGPARVTFRMGVGYDQGDFGTGEISRAAYLPVSVRFAGNLFDFTVSSSFARIDTSEGVRLIDGVPTQTGDGVPLQESGIGDTIVRSRFFVWDNKDSELPSVTPFVRVKIPTAREELGLGTGKTDVGFGIEVDKRLNQVFVFGDLGYAVVGKVPALDLRNRPAAGFGVGRDLSESTTISGMFDWRRSIVAGNPDPAELTGILSYRLSPSVTLSPNGFVGLTSGSSDFGVGLQMSLRFNRF
jgi:hypothetical protein